MMKSADGKAYFSSFFLLTRHPINSFFALLKSFNKLIILTCNDMSHEKKIITSSKAPEPVGAYPHARRVGNLLFLSGVGPREKGTKKIPGVELDDAGNIISYDIEAQCHSVFQNVKWILEEAGSSWDRLVDVTVFLTNMKDDFKSYNRLYAEYFKTNQPCRTTVEINCLPTPIAIELKVIATID
jgi:2-aminomuconate deaminase